MVRPGMGVVMSPSSPEVFKHTVWKQLVRHMLEAKTA